MSMESFYGGRQGASFIIVYKFDTILEDKSGAYKIKELAVENGTDVYYVTADASLNYSFIERSGDNYKQYTWKKTICNGDQVSAKVVGSGDAVTINLNTLPTESMEACFKAGGATTNKVNYGEYVIIDTLDKSNPDNGKVYRRGMNYDSDLGGAEYIGQIVGPKGDIPDIEILNYNDSGLDNGRVITRTVGTEDLIPGYTPGVSGVPAEYIDNVLYKYVVVEDPFGDLTGYNIGFRTPYTIVDFQASATNPYKTEGLISKRESTQEWAHGWDSEANKWTHPFYQPWKVEIPQGVHGADIDNLQIVYTKTKPKGFGIGYEQGVEVFADKELTYHEAWIEEEYEIIRESQLDYYNEDEGTSYDDGNPNADYCKIFYPAGSENICYVKKINCHRGVYRYLVTYYDDGDPGTGEPYYNVRCCYINLDLFDNIKIETRSDNSQYNSSIANDGTGDQKVHIAISRGEEDLEDIPIGGSINYIVETLVINDSSKISPSSLTPSVTPAATYGHLIVYFSDPALRQQLATRFPERMLSYPSNIYPSNEGDRLAWGEWFDLGQTRWTRTFPILTTVASESDLYHEVGGEQVAYKPEELPKSDGSGDPIDEMAKGWGVSVKGSSEEIARFFSFDYDTLEWIDSGTLNASIVDPHYVIDKSTTGETIRVNEGGIWLIQSTATYADFT